METLIIHPLYFIHLFNEFIQFVKFYKLIKEIMRWKAKFFFNTTQSEVFKCTFYDFPKKKVHIYEGSIFIKKKINICILFNIILDQNICCLLVVLLKLSFFFLKRSSTYFLNGFFVMKINLFNFWMLLFILKIAST